MVPQTKGAPKMATRNRPSPEEIRRSLEEAHKEAHRRLAARKERVTKVIQESDKVQDRLRRAASR